MWHEASALPQLVGWAKRKRAHVLLTFQLMFRVGTARARLCPPYGFGLRLATFALAPAPEIAALLAHEARQHHLVHFGGAVDRDAPSARAR